MKNNWDNLFWYQQKDDENKHQSENNTTKSFLKVLKETKKGVTRALVEKILDTRINDVTEYKYSYQVPLRHI